MPLDVVETLLALIAIPSVNPMGREVSGPPYGEAALTDHLETLFKKLGLRTHRWPIAPGRDNLIARLDGDTTPEQGGPMLLLDAHQDTVPADHMTVAPWTPEVRGGRVYGRGACDTKGGMAAMLTAIARLAQRRPAGMPTVVMTCTVDEEYRRSGAPAVASSWAEHTGGLIPREPDAAVVAEPTGLDVIVAHKGVVRWHCHTHGRAAHSSKPEAGDNAIFKMAGVLAALQRFQRDLAQGDSHPLCGPCTFNVGTIRGGTSINIVPERCGIEMEIRMPPGMTPEVARQRVIDSLAAVPGVEPPIHDPPYMQAPPLSDAASAPLADRLSAVINGMTGNCRRRAVPYATNAAFFAQTGTPSVIFGPGFIEQAHTEDEWLPLDQLHQAVEILERFVERWKEG